MPNDTINIFFLPSAAPHSDVFHTNHSLFRQLSRSAMSIAQSLHEASLKSSTQNRRQVHSNVQDKINDSVGDIRLYEKGLKVEN